MKESEIWNILEEVKDPEIPVLSVVDLGIVRKVEERGDNDYLITITPTYSGCPAMDTIEREIKEILQKRNISTEIKTSISPAWTTDWLTEKGRKNLEEYGIAPPSEASTDKSFLTGKHKAVRCPQCKSENTSLVSQFGSTACKALYKCNDCLENFDYFKCI